MGLWKRIEEKIWTGKVLRDYGPLDEGLYGGAKRKVSAMLTERSDGHRFMIRSSYTFFLSASVSFVELDREAATKLKVALDAALHEMQ